MSVAVYYSGQGGQPLRMVGWQTENQGGQREENFWRFAPNFIKQIFAHPWPETLPAPL